VKKEKWGLLGGTFNPIHFGHLRLAEEVRENLSLKKIIFIPAGQPPHKKEKEIINVKHRFKMVEIAIKSNPYFSLSSAEVKRKGVSYSIETVSQFKKEYPQIDFYFLMGTDAFLEIATWREAEKFLSTCQVVVVSRPGYPFSSILAEWKKKVIMLKIEGLEISSTQIRKRIRENRSIKYLVPEEVLNYLTQSRLYLSSGKT
jgi:nicotinate-nucleotide adenylyltransferase